jgi:ribonuclease PH
MARIDGRNYDAVREVNLTRGFISKAEGSCLIELGKTRVVCTASVEDKVPAFLRGKGAGWVTAEYGMLPRSTASRRQRDKLSGRTFEIQRLIGRSLRSVVDLSNLGERTIWVDCDVIEADGGTRTASITGGFIALVDCLNRLKEEDKISSIPVSAYLSAISVGIVKRELLLDLNYFEDSRADIDMNVAMNSKGEFVEIQGTAEKNSFSKKLLDSMLDLSKQGIDFLIDEQRKLLRDILLI